jgi:small RNA 2'-O-methyltransferase
MLAVSSEVRGAPAGSAENQYTNDVRINKEKPDLFKCEVNIRSRKQEILLEYSAADTWSKESDAIQNSSLKVLIWFNNYFKKLTSKTGKLYLSESTAGVKVHSNIFFKSLQCVYLFMARMEAVIQQCAVQLDHFLWIHKRSTLKALQS